MGALDLQIGWLHKRKACAEDVLRDLKRGRKIEIDEKDVTQEWIATYERIIAKYRELIVAYRARGPLKPRALGGAVGHEGRSNGGVGQREGEIR